MNAKNGTATYRVEDGCVVGKHQDPGFEATPRGPILVHSQPQRHRHPDRYQGFLCRVPTLLLNKAHNNG